MVNAAIVGLGWWGQVLVDSVQDKSDVIKFTHGATRTKSKAQDYADKKGFSLVDSYEELLSIDDLDAVVLATPHSAHRGQIEAAAAAGKHVFCEKPLTLTKADAEAAIAACDDAGVVCATGFNRRFHPAVAEAKKLVTDGKMGELMHVEGTMCAPNGMFLAADAWRADKNETPAGGLTPMGVHVIDVYINLFGEIDEVYCQSFRRAVPNDTDDTTSILFRFKNGMSGYMANMLATAPSFRVPAYGLGGSFEIRKPDLSSFEFIPNGDGPITGATGKVEAQSMDFSGFDMVNAELESFGTACSGGAAYPVPHNEVIHGVAVLEAVVKSAESGQPVKVG
jgi:predicted dehydrogenase